MNDRQGQQEPTMEEILASIRRIISDDEKPPEEVEDKPQAAAAPKAGKKAPPPEERDEETDAETDAAEPEPALEEADDEPLGGDIADEDDVLELTEMVNEDGSVVSLKDETDDTGQPVAEEKAGAKLLSDQAASSTANAFANLAGAVAATRGTPIGGGGRTLEEMVKELLRPMLREWLDDNLPALVERLVQKEIAKLSRQAEEERLGDED